MHARGASRTGRDGLPQLPALDGEALLNDQGIREVDVEISSSEGQTHMPAKPLIRPEVDGREVDVHASRLEGNASADRGEARHNVVVPAESDGKLVLKRTVCRTGFLIFT